jgi:hypothetical protein
MSATSMQSITEASFPANGTPLQKMKFALKYAALAPTEGHWQPWEVRMADTHLELLAREEPALAAFDPDGRELMIACGAALLYLKLALKHFGCLGRVALFPDLGNPALVARVHFGSCRERGPKEKLLFEAMTFNRANPSPLGGTPVSETMLAVLDHAAAGERGWLDFVQSETSRQNVLKITLSDDLAAQRVADSWNVTVEPVRGSSDSAATLAVVKTKTDDNHGWLEAGQTMARTVLQAQALGLSWAFFNPVRRREARAALRMGVGHKGFAQVILRFDPLITGETARLTTPVTATATYR